MTECLTSERQHGPASSLVTDCTKNHWEQKCIKTLGGLLAYGQTVCILRDAFIFKDVIFQKSIMTDSSWGLIGQIKMDKPRLDEFLSNGCILLGAFTIIFIVKSISLVCIGGSNVCQMFQKFSSCFVLL